MINVYEGNEPFVFISYAHEDEASVMPIIKALEDRGIRLWYDAGIEPGMEWRDYIAAHIEACACMLCFLSPNYSDSRPCRKELNYAEDLGIPTISIHLEEFQLCGGLKMQLDSTQALFSWRFRSEDALADNLTKTPKVAACRKDGDAEKKKSRRVVSVPVRKSGKPNVTNLLKRADLALEDGDWEDAAEFSEQVLNMEPENPKAYLKMLLAQMQVKNVEQLATATEFSEDNKHYKKLLRFADEETKAALAQTLTRAKNEKRHTSPVATMTWEKLVESIEKKKSLRVENEPAESDDLFEEIFAEVDESFCDEIDTAQEDVFAPVLIKEENKSSCNGNEAAEAEFKKNATIENGVLKMYNGSEADVFIPGCVTGIGEYAFTNCKSLISVTIPGSVTHIERGVFSFCEALASVTIPGSVTSIGENAFSYCKSLVSVKIPDNVTSIGECAFSGCERLTSVTIPNGVTRISKNAFSNCKSLTSVTIPNSVTSIDAYAFSGCKSLTSVTIPNSVTSIEEGAFAACMLTAVTIPDSVSRMDANPFANCSRLTKIAVSANHPYFYVQDGHLIDKRTKTLVTGCASAPIPTKGSVTRIGGSAFSGNMALTSVTIPNGVTSIGEFAFAGCSFLASVTIPNSVISIEWGAFVDCWELTSVTIPSGVTGIGKRAFAECWALASVTIPSSVSVIDESAFERCSKDMTIFTPKDSYAWKWAERKHIPVQKVRAFGKRGLLPVIGK